MSRHTPVYLGQYSRWYPADASDINKMPAIGLTLEPMKIGQLGSVLIGEQMVEDENWNWMAGMIIYVSTVASVFNPAKIAGVPRDKIKKVAGVAA